jgi:tetratricopeptide (TPR) repeat protein
VNTPTPNAAERLRQGHALQTQGKLTEAANIYREVLEQDPGNAPAMHLLGVLVMQTGQVEPGVELIRQALAILPGFAPAHDNLGKGLERLGRMDEALTAFGRVIALAPGHAEGYANRGRVLESLGRFEEALKDFDKALSLKGDPEFSLNRGAVLLQMARFEEALNAFDKAIAMGLTHIIGRFNRAIALTALNRREEALAAYDDAIQRQPDFADAYVNRGLLLEGMGRQQDALASFEQAIAINPDQTEAYLNRGVLLSLLGRHKEAVSAYDALLARWPDHADAYNNRGAAQKALGALDKALADFDRAIALRPNDANLRDNRGNALQAVGRFEDALATYDAALAADPTSERAAFSKATLLLLTGRLAEGWPLYEKRPRLFAVPGLDESKSWRNPAADIAGKTVLVYDEQGLGDAIQFARFVATIAKRGATPVVMVRAPLVALLKGLTPAASVVAHSDAPPPHDLHASLNSLPFLLDLKDSVGMTDAYLTADAARVARWKKAIGDKGFKIGIAWQGKTGGNNDAERSFPLKALAPLAKIPGVRLISLQKGEGEAALADLAQVESLGADFDAGGDAFLDTAAAMQSLDLVITCDTSIAHLAGALARPCWVALKRVPEWRWQLERDDTPWYPATRLFRQPARGDWDSVFAGMAAALRDRAA